jgi:hypothetical protein
MLRADRNTLPFLYFAGTLVPGRPAAVQRLAFDNDLKLVTAANANFNDEVGLWTTLADGLKSSRVNTVFPAREIGAQLQTDFAIAGCPPHAGPALRRSRRLHLRARECIPWILFAGGNSAWPRCM